MKAYFAKRPALSWALYDWANSGFSTTVMVGFFPVFFRQYWSTGVDPTEATFRLGLASGIAGLLMALLAPVLGAIADYGGHRVRFVAAWSLLGIASTAALFFVGQGDWVGAVVVFTLATLGFNGGIIFYDALLVDVAKPAEYDRISAYGYALGYLGGGLLFAVNILMVVKPGWFGLATAADAVRWSFLTVVLWWALFMLPLLTVRETPGRSGVGAWVAVKEGWASLRVTLPRVAANRQMLLFLAAYFLYIDGVATIYKMAVDYGLALGLDTAALLGALLLTQFVGFPAAIAFGRLGERIGPRQAILLGVAIYAVVTVWAYWLDSTLEFFVMAIAVGLVQGGVQGLSRSFYGRLVPPAHSAEFFGFFNMMGKFSTVLGPLLVGYVALVTHDSRLSIAAVAVLFVGGGVLLWRVKDPQGAGASSAGPGDHRAGSSP
ncbi:MAG: hypothetical protein RL026_189 [Pseudomonadota bacterium]|jgi:UMF1 family MFS transporter